MINQEIKVRIQQLKMLLSPNLGSLYYLFCSFGLAVIIKNITSTLSEIILKNNLIAFNAWIIPFYYPEKRYVLLSYLVTAAVLFVYYLLFNLFVRANLFKKEYTSHNENISILLFFVSAAFNLYLLFYYRKYTSHHLALYFAVWFFFFLFPLFYHSYDRISQFSSRFKVIYSFMLSIIIVQIAVIFYSLTIGDIKIKNEFLDIPETTILDGAFVDNDKYISEHNLFGNKDKYSIELHKGNTPSCRNGFFIKIPESIVLAEVISADKNMKFYYNNEDQALCFYGKLTKDDVYFLRTVLNDSLNPFEKNASSNKDYSYKSLVYRNANDSYIDNLFWLNKVLHSKLQSKHFTDQELSFLKNNQYELQEMIYGSTLFFHHHNHILSPITEYMNGKDPDKIYFIYGWLPTLTIQKIMTFLGGISYQNYFRSIFSFYPIYYFFFIVAAILLFRKLEYVLLSLMLGFAAINHWGYVPLIVAPGYVPFRHFFDVFVLISLVLYVRSKNVLFAIFACALALVAIISDSNFGLFLLVALLLTLTIRLFSEHANNNRRIETLLICASFVFGLFIKLGFKIGTDLMTKYFLSGLLAFPFSAKLIVVILLVISFSYYVIIKLSWEDETKYAALFLLFYSQAIMIYWILLSEPWHFLSIAPIIYLSIVVMIYLLIRNSLLKKIEHNLLMFVILFSFATYYAPGVVKFYVKKWQYDKIFETHKTYQWDFERAKFQTTMNPVFFKEAVNQLKKYSSENSVHLISKYDVLLPFLANKYSAMPFFEVSSFLLTDKEIRMCKNKIATDNPKYLFVDTDIERNMNSDIVDREAQFLGYLHNRSVSQVRKLNLLKEIFKSVKNKYKPIEKGLLITVYERII